MRGAVVESEYPELIPGCIDHGRSIYPAPEARACGFCGSGMDAYRWGDEPSRVEQDCLICDSQFITRIPLNTPH